MLFLRSSLFLLGQVVTAPIFTLIAFLALPLNPVTRNVLISGWARSMIWWLRITCGIRHEVTGLENLPKSPSIILSKHQSAWETLAFQAIFPTQVYVLKRELLWIPIFGWGLAMSSPIAINRSAGRAALKQLVEQGAARLANGLWVVIYPEGTRMAPGERGKYQIGGAWLATHTQALAVPVAHNAGRYWAKKLIHQETGHYSYSYRQTG
jgi:1-acyl-sn-glycerol-3-phosphate acyltransferase